MCRTLPSQGIDPGRLGGVGRRCKDGRRPLDGGGQGSSEAQRRGRKGEPRRAIRIQALDAAIRRLAEECHVS